MSRTPLFAAVKRALARSFHEQGLVVPQTSALTRRRLLRISAAAAGAAALSPVLDWSAYAKQERPKGPVAIIGGGVAGLTAAYRLQAAGATPIVFEASNRWGGRMFTVYDFYKGMFCELGGEFVDTGHEDLQKLGAEVGVEMQNSTAEGEGEDIYFFGGTVPYAEGHGRSGEEDRSLSADSQANRRRRRQAYRQRRQLDVPCPQARST